MTDYSKRRNCPLDAGDIVIDTTTNNVRLRFVKWTNGGLRFERTDTPEHITIEQNDFAEMWTNGDLERL